MLTRRIIPCLDVRDDRVVKGIAFANLRDMGDPLDLACRYAQQGADELCFLNVSASVNEEPLILDLVRRVSKSLFVPFTVGGGIRSADDARAVLRAGADKVSLNTAAIINPELINTLSYEFGNQCVVLSIDTRRVNSKWLVTTHSATKTHGKTCVDWASEGVERGAGEILLNVIDTDGSRSGFSLEITGKIADTVGVPVIASGGAGSADDFVEVFNKTNASAALAASIFHDNSWTPHKLKQHLSDRGIEVRL